MTSQPASIAEMHMLSLCAVDVVSFSSTLDYWCLFCDAVEVKNQCLNRG